MLGGVNKRPLLAVTLGVVAFGTVRALFGAPADDPAGDVQREIVVTARRSDAAIAARVTAALQQDPYIFAEHVTVMVQNGVVTIQGVVTDLNDLLAILNLARHVAGKAKVVNEIDFQPIDDDGG